MARLSRVDASAFGRWWRSVDRVTLACVGVLIGFGYILMLAASPAVAVRIGASRNMFIFKQVVFLLLAGGLTVSVSMLSRRGVVRVGFIGSAIAIAATALTLIHGMEIKGARRWIALPMMSVQPSEFLKPCFAVLTGWLLSWRPQGRRFDGPVLAVACYAVIVFLLKSQPDIGMTTVITAVFFVQCVVNGLSMILVAGLFGLMIAAGIGAYFLFPHVHSRVDRFIHPNVGDHYQIDTAMRAFGNGGLLGRGPGEGRVKDLLPDAHADFVFAVAGEEYGLLICLFIIAVFATIVVRALLKLLREDDPFVILAVSGLATGFGLQSFVNMASTLHLIPTKGMTLPFISYGGSSALSVALTVGMLLALTRQRVGQSRLGRTLTETQGTWKAVA